jgi:hypothetical protein
MNNEDIKNIKLFFDDFDCPDVRLNKAISDLMEYNKKLESDVLFSNERVRVLYRRNRDRNSLGFKWASNI